MGISSETGVRSSGYMRKGADDQFHNMKIIGPLLAS
jgi:hypothetical protein